MNRSDRRWPVAVALVAATMLAAAVLPASANSAWLAGSQWGYPLGGGAGHGRSVRFAVDGVVHVNGGCNKFRGSYDQTGSAITISPIAATRKACPEAVMARERSFLAALTNARSVEAAQHKLVLLDADGTELLRLVRQDWD